MLSTAMTRAQTALCQGEQRDRCDDQSEREHTHDQHGGIASGLCGSVEVKEGIALHGRLPCSRWDGLAAIRARHHLSPECPI